MKKSLLGLIIILVSLFIIGCGSLQQTSLSLKDSEVDLYVGDTYEIKAVLKNSENEIIYTVFEGSEFVKCKNMRKDLDYIYKTEMFLKPYFNLNKEEV